MYLVNLSAPWAYNQTHGWKVVLPRKRWHLFALAALAEEQAANPDPRL